MMASPLVSARMASRIEGGSGYCWSRMTVLASSAFWVSHDTIIEAQPHANEHVGHADSLVDMGGAMHSRHANAQRMSFREGTDTEQRGDHRDIDFLSKSAQFIICL